MNQNTVHQNLKRLWNHLEIMQRGEPVRKVAALTRNFSPGVHTFSLNFRQC